MIFKYFLSAIQKQLLKTGGILIFCLICIPTVFADITPDTILYEGRLLDTEKKPVTSSQTFRLSLWSSADLTAADKSGDAINVGSATYGNWQEVQTITPNTSGTFSIQLGSVTPLPEIDFSLHKYLQVEIKPSASADSEYQLMDPTGDDGADTNDRKEIGAVPYAKVADSVKSSKEESFLIDSDDTIFNAGTGSVQLKFGETLGKFLEYDLDNNFFRFNDSLHVEGDITLTGLVDGVDISNLATSTHGQNTDIGTNSPTFEVNNTGPKLTIDSAGITANRTVTFYDGDMVVVGEDTTQTLTNKNIDGEENTITNIDISAFKDRNRTLLLAPELENVSVNPDGTDNMVSLNQGYDQPANQRYYVLSTQEAALQDLDIVIPVIIPDDFVSWQPIPIQVDIKSSSIFSADNQMDIEFYDTTNTLVPLTGSTGIIGNIADTWEQKDITFNGGSPTFAAGESAMIHIKLKARSANRIYIGRIRIHYVGK